MNIRLKYFILLFALLVSAKAALSQSNESLFSSANLHYTEQEFSEAINLYEIILTKGGATCEVYFNLANSYYKSSELGKAILNYERAKRLNPDDDDINFNLKMANRETIDKIEPIPQVFYEQWWDAFVVGKPLNYRASTLIILIWLTALVFSAYLLFDRIYFRKISLLLTSVLLISSILMAALTMRQNDYLSKHQSAIILNSNIYVKSSPDVNSSNLFMLHEGTKVDVLDNLNEWKKVRIANGNVGWTNKENLENI
jgi:tetratricopeptide (TPR) repeat protein